MSELTREQLLEYVKKQKVKMKQLEEKVSLYEGKGTAGVDGALHEELEKEKQKVLKYNILVKEKIKIIEEQAIEIKQLKEKLIQSNEKPSDQNGTGDLLTMAGADIGATLSSWSTSFFQDISSTLAEVTSLSDETTSIVATTAADNDNSPNYKAIISELEAQIATLRTEKDGLAQKWNVAEKKVESLTAEIDFLSRSSTKIENNLLSIQEVLDGKVGEIASLTTSLLSAQSEVVALNERLRSNESEGLSFDSYKNSILERESEIAALKNKVIESEKENNVALVNCRVKIDELGSANETLSAKNSELQQLLSNKESEMNASDKKLAEAKQRLSASVQEKDNEVASLRSKIQELEQGDKTKVDSELETLRSKVSALTDEKNASDKQLAEVEQRLSTSMQEKDNEVASLRCKIQELEQGDKTKVDSEVETLRSKIQELEQGDKTKVDTKVKTLRNKVSALTDEKNALGKQLAEVEQRLSASVQEKDNEVASLRSKIQELEQGDKAKVDSEVETLRSKVSALTDEKNALGTQLTDVEQRLSASVQSLSTSVQEKDNEVASLRSKIQELEQGDKAKVDSELETLRSKVSSLENELITSKDVAKELSVALERKELELGTFISTKASNDANEATLVTKISALQFECNSLNESLVKISTEHQNKQLIADDALKSLSQMYNESESKLAASLTSLTTLQSKLLALEQDSDEIREERERQRRRVLELEGVIEQNIRLMQEKAPQHDDSGQNTELSTQLNHYIHTLCTDLTRAKASSSNFSERENQLMEQLNSEKLDHEVKMEMLNDKIKKLKVLLTKSKSLVQEKEAEIGNLTTMEARPKRFTIQARVLMPEQDGTTAHAIWCLVIELFAPGAKATNPCRWAVQAQVDQWIQDGSVLVGATPVVLQEELKQKNENQVSELKRENDAMTSELQQLKETFDAYKNRAAAALKRLGQDERTEKQKTIHAESEQIGKFNEIIHNLELQLTASSRSADEEKIKNESLQKELLARKEQVEALSDEMATLNESIDMLNGAVQRLTKENSEVKSLYNTQIATIEDLKAQLRSHLTPDPVLVTKVEVNEVAVTVESPMKEATSEESAAVVVPDNIAVTLESDPHSTLNILNANLNKHKQLKAAPPPTDNYDDLESLLLSTPKSASKGNKQLLLFEQNEKELHNAMVELRQLNANLSLEVLDMKRTAALGDEQIAVLKESLREVEIKLVREREFNSESHRLNAEYLVNVLKSFLLSDNPSEKSKLVGVLCSILHFKPEETSQVAEKWKVRPGGLIGQAVGLWLQKK